MSEKIADHRARLLEAAEKSTYRFGFGNTAIADIAKQARIPLGNVYYYFKTKDEIGNAIVNLRVSRFRKLLQDTLGGRERSAPSKLFNQLSVLRIACNQFRSFR